NHLIRAPVLRPSLIFGGNEQLLLVLLESAEGFRGLVRLLEKHPSYLPKAMVRDPSQGRRFDELGVPWVAGDLEAGAPSATDLDGSDVVIFAAGAGRDRPDIKKVTIDYLGAVKSVASCQETESVKRFVLLSGINSDPEGTRRSTSASGDDLLGPLSAWHRLKANSEAYVKTSHLHGRSLDWTILCPGRLLDDEAGGPGTGRIKASLIHGEDDLKESLTPAERKAAAKTFPGSHDGKMERLCVSRDNTATALVGLLGAPNTIGKSVTIVDGILPVDEALSEIA
ncbi:hypothetical protein ACHAWF_001517, partial [Thalassiosira exigua]